MGFSARREDSRILLCCCAKRNSQGKALNTIEEKVRKRKEEQMIILKLRKDKRSAMSKQAQRLKKKNMWTMNYPCVVKCQSVCQSENLSKWAEWVLCQHCFNLSKSSRHSIKYNVLQIFLISCSESSLYNFGWFKAVACRSHTYSVFWLCIWICAIWKVGELLADLARRARAENQAKITGLEHLPCEERLGGVGIFQPGAEILQDRHNISA